MPKMTKMAREVWEHQFGDSEIGIDPFGFQIHKSAYGNPNSKYGWDVDHIIPLSGTKGYVGRDEIENMQAVYIEANRQKGNKTAGRIAIGEYSVDFSIEINPFYPTKNNKKNGIYCLHTNYGKMMIYDSYVIVESKYEDTWWIRPIVIDDYDGNIYVESIYDYSKWDDESELISIFEIPSYEIYHWDEFDGDFSKIDIDE